MPESRRRLLHAAVLTLVFSLALTVRVWDISRHFWLLADQIRDWGIVQGSFASLPFVGPPTHVHGYTIGPAFYWILWGIRVVFGPWFDNLPHGGGIGQATLQSAADTLLFVGVWRRSQSVWLALTAAVVIVTASYDLCLAAVVWNPMVGLLLAKTATALVLLDWHRGSTMRTALTAAAAWSAVHAYTGAIFVAVGVLGAIVLDPIWRGEGARARRHALVVVLVVAALQLPLVLHQMARRFGDPAMAAVTGSVGEILSGGASPRFAASVAGYGAAFTFIEVQPLDAPWFVWVLAACGVLLAIRFRRDPALLLVTLVPQILAMAGYAFFLSGLDNYYYYSLMPAAVLTVLLGATAFLPPRLVQVTGVALLAGALAVVPARIRFATTLHHMPQYGALVDGSRKMARLGRPMRAVRTEFDLPVTSDSEFLFTILGGRIDPQSPWIGTIAADGGVSYRKVE